LRINHCKEHASNLQNLYTLFFQLVQGPWKKPGMGKKGMRLWKMKGITYVMYFTISPSTASFSAIGRCLFDSPIGQTIRAG
jgi:hypothetical protein